MIPFPVVPIAPTHSSTPARWPILLACAALALAAFGAYHNSFSGQLVYDDIAAIKENPTITNLRDLRAVFSPPNDSGITVNGRPLINLSLAINYAIGGTEVFGYHVMNFFIHLCAGLTLFGIVRRSLELPSLKDKFATAQTRLLAAFVVALLWTVHPLQTESVTYIIQRAESLVGLFYLLTFYCFVRSVTSPRPGLWQGLTVFACLCGMASKEVMASAPLLVLVYDRAVISGTFREAWRRHVRIYLGLAATWILLAWLVHGTNNRGGTAGLGAGGMSSWHYALTQCLGLGKYLKLVFWPDPLVFDYGTALEEHLLPVLPQALLIVSLVVGTGYALWRRPMLGFLGLWCFAILGPSSSFIPVASEPLAEHRMYLPLAALAALVVLSATRRFGRGALYLCLALAVAAGAVTVQRNLDYRDETALWRDTQRKYPSNARAHNNVGEILFRADRQQEAVECFREAVRLLPRYIDALNNLGNTLTQLGKPTEGLPYLELALQLKPSYGETHNNLGNAYYQLDRVADAVASYQESLRLKPSFGDAHNNLGVALVKLGKPKEAIPHYVQALRLRENYIDAHYNYGIALNEVGRTAEAAQQYRETIRLKPTHAEAHHNLGSLVYGQGNFAEAERLYREAIRLKPDYIEAFKNFGLIMFQAGRLPEAETYFAAALKLNPDYSEARSGLAETRKNLGDAAFLAGKFADAQSLYEQTLRLDPNHAVAHKNLGAALWRQGRLEPALAQFETAVHLSPDFKDAIASIAQLKAQIAAQK